MSPADKQLSESGENAREEKRERRLREIRYFAVVAFVFLVLFLLGWAGYDYAYVCRIRIPKGTTVVERIAVMDHAGYFDFLFKSRAEWIKPYLPYLKYRHYVIPDGATEIGRSAFDIFYSPPICL